MTSRPPSKTVCMTYDGCSLDCLTMTLGDEGPTFIHSPDWVSKVVLGGANLITVALRHDSSSGLGGCRYKDTRLTFTLPPTMAIESLGIHASKSFTSAACAGCSFTCRWQHATLHPDRPFNFPASAHLLQIKPVGMSPSLLQIPFLQPPPLPRHM